MHNSAELEKYFNIFDEIERTGGEIVLTEEASNPKQMIVNVESGFEKSQGIRKDLEKNVDNQKYLSIPLDLDKISVSDAYIDQKILKMNLAKQNLSESFIEDSAKNNTLSTPYPVITKHGGGRDYTLFKSFIYKTKWGCSITAYEGFITDLASVPRLFWLFINPDELSLSAPIIHDLLYRNGGELSENQVHTYRTFNRLDSDEIFLEIMESENISNWRCRAAYFAVRKFGRSAWQGSDETGD